MNTAGKGPQNDRPGTKDKTESDDDSLPRASPDLETRVVANFKARVEAGDARSNFEVVSAAHSVEPGCGIMSAGSDESSRFGAIWPEYIRCD